MVTIKHLTCPVCGCLCDDIEVTVENGKVIGIRNGYPLSNAKFMGFAGEYRLGKPLIRKDDKFIEVTLKEVLHEAVEIPADANCPILYGWSSTNCEAQRVGEELTEEVGGVLDNTSTSCHGPSILAIQ
jgi:formylmethanofuran dehydrogenase subunit B